MTISVIIPAYNAQSFIVSCLRTVNEQTYQKHIEIVVVDDGSTDDTVKLVESFEQELFSNRSLLLIKQRNQGVSFARNKGVHSSKGEYIAFLDADDYWHPQKLEIVIPLMKDHNIVVLGHGFTLKNNFDYKFSLDESLLTLKKVTSFSLLLKNFAVTPSVVVKKDTLLDFDNSLRYAEDHDLWLRLSFNSPIHYIDLALTLLGREPLTDGGLSAHRWKMRLGEMKMYLKVGKQSYVLVIFIPFLIIFSFLKHLRSEFLRLLK